MRKGMVIKAQGTSKECDIIHLEPVGTQSGKAEVREKPVPDSRGLCILGCSIQKLFSVGQEEPLRGF